MIYVECKPDALLVGALTNLPKREIVHELKAKYEILGRISRGSHLRAMIDEDPGANQPAYLRRMRVLQDLPESGLRLLGDEASNRVIVLRPRLEEWVIRAARETGLDMDRYGLPSEGRKLHQVINVDLRKFERVIDDLNRSPRLRALAGMLQGPQG